MADITMCDNQECRIRNSCYRARAIPSDYQSWSIFNKENKDDCKHYLERVPHTRKAEKAVDW